MAASTWTTSLPGVLDALPDERLARLAARGDRRAFDALFARHRGGLTRYCRSVLRHEADAEDAAQNALLAAHRALEGGTVPMRVKPWLYRIAHNEAISVARTRRPAEELDESALPAMADAAEAGEVRRRLGELLTDLRALTERQRQALVLRELSGLSHAEIAQVLDTSEAAAQQTVFEARSALQQFGEGRALACERVQRAMSECDGARLRTRRFRAHLRDCEPCRCFEAALRMRRRDLGLLFPATGAGGVLAALGRLLGGHGEVVLAGLGAKGAAIGLVALAGGGAVVATSSAPGDHGAAAPAPRSVPAAASAASATPAARERAAEPAATPSRDRRERRRSAAGKGRRPQGAGRPDGAMAPAGRDPAPAPKPAVTTHPAPDGTTIAAPVGSRGDATVDSGAPAPTTPRVPTPAAAPAPVADAVGAVAVPAPVPPTADTVAQAVQEAASSVGKTLEEPTAAVEDALRSTTGLRELP